MIFRNYFTSHYSMNMGACKMGQDEIRLIADDMQRWLDIKHGNRIVTEKQFLDRKRICENCARQSTCRKVQIGYFEEHGLSYEYNGRVNKMLGHKDSIKCCVWDGPTASAILNALAEAKRKGEVA